MHRYLRIVLSMLLFLLGPNTKALPINLSVDQATAISLIKQTINLFPILVDSHIFSEFSNVFTANATADLKAPDGSIFHGVDEISTALSGLAGVKSQHGFTSQYVNITSPSTANATTYLFANFFGQGEMKGQLFTEYGIYTTQMLLTKDGWRIDYMLLTNLDQTGDETIAFPKTKKD